MLLSDIVAEEIGSSGIVCRLVERCDVEDRSIKGLRACHMLLSDIVAEEIGSSGIVRRFATVAFFFLLRNQGDTGIATADAACSDVVSWPPSGSFLCKSMV
jgi:hypothetical protein